MSLTEELFRWASGVVVIVFGAVIKQVHNRIDKVEKKVAVVADTHIDANHCKLTGALRMEKIEHLREDFLNMKSDNRDQHEHIGSTLDAIKDALTDVQECVTKLSVGRECD